MFQLIAIYLILFNLSSYVAFSILLIHLILSFILSYSTVFSAYR